MSSYREESDRFHEMREQHERDLLAASNLDELIERLKARGVDVDELIDSLLKLKKGLGVLKIQPEAQKKVIAQILAFKLGVDER